MKLPVMSTEMKNLSIICLCLIIILSFTGCDKNDSFHDPATGKYLYILNGESDTVCSNFYDKNGLLIKSISHDNAHTPGENAELSYTYNSDNLLVKKTGYIPGIMYMSSYQGAIGKEVKSVYEYDSDKRLSKITTDFHYPEFADIDYSMTQTFEYMDDKVIEYNGRTTGESTLKTEYLFNKKGNIHTKFYYYKSDADSFRITNMEEFTYDNYRAPYQVEPTPKSKNNVLSYKITHYQNDGQGIYSKSSTTEYINEYEYNINGYPEKQSITYPNGYVEIRIYKY
jgi:hypothetical protein